MRQQIAPLRHHALLLAGGEAARCPRRRPLRWPARHGQSDAGSRRRGRGAQPLVLFALGHRGQVLWQDMAGTAERRVHRAVRLFFDEIDSIAQASDDNHSTVYGMKTEFLKNADRVSCQAPPSTSSAAPTTPTRSITLLRRFARCTTYAAPDEARRLQLIRRLVGRSMRADDARLARLTAGLGPSDLTNLHQRAKSSACGGSCAASPSARPRRRASSSPDRPAALEDGASSCPPPTTMRPTTSRSTTNPLPEGSGRLALRPRLCGEGGGGEGGEGGGGRREKEGRQVRWRGERITAAPAQTSRARTVGGVRQRQQRGGRKARRRVESCRALRRRVARGLHVVRAPPLRRASSTSAPERLRLQHHARLVDAAQPSDVGAQGHRAARGAHAATPTRCRTPKRRVEKRVHVVRLPRFDCTAVHARRGKTFGCDVCLHPPLSFYTQGPKKMWTGPVAQRSARPRPRSHSTKSRLRMAAIATMCADACQKTRSALRCVTSTERHDRAVRHRHEPQLCVPAVCPP